MKNKTLYGTLSVLYIIIFLSLLIAINLFFNKLDIKYDMTKEKIYMLSDQTKKIINNLDQKINIYILASPSEKNYGKEAYFINNISSQYKSKNITIKYKDPEKNPTFMRKYNQDQNQKIPDNSVIVESQKKYKLIEPDKLFTYEYYDFDYETLSPKAKLKNINVESEISNAISYVISDYTPKIYKLIGHGENDLSENYKKQIESSNYEIQNLNLITSQKIPDDCKILFITTPEKDFTSQEVDLINNFLDSGSAIIFMSLVNKDLPNLKNLTKKYGFEFNNFISIENNADNYIDNNLCLLPNYGENNICQKLEAKNYSLLIPCAQNIFIDQAQKDKIQTLLSTSNNSYAKDSNNSSTFKKEENDPTGPLNLAIYYINNKTKIIAVGSESVLDDITNERINGANLDFVVNSINDLNDEGENIYIAPKNYDSSRVNFTQNQANIIAITSSFIFPAMIFISGILILKSRKVKN